MSVGLRGSFAALKPHVVTSTAVWRSAAMYEGKWEVRIISLVSYYFYFFKYRFTCYFSFIQCLLENAGGRRGKVKIV